MEFLPKNSASDEAEGDEIHGARARPRDGHYRHSHDPQDPAESEITADKTSHAQESTELPILIA